MKVCPPSGLHVVSVVRGQGKGREREQQSVLILMGQGRKGHTVGGVSHLRGLCGVV